MKIKLLAILLLLAVLAGFAACGGTSGGTTTTSPSITAPGTSTPGTSEPTPPATTEDYGKSDPNLESIDYDGKSFDILQRTNEWGAMYEEWNVFETANNVVSQAVYDRNMYLEEKYNINIEIAQEHRQRVATVYVALAQTDASPYELLDIGFIYNQRLVVEGFIQAASNIPHLDFEKDYWHTDIMDLLSFSNEYYILSSDINIGLYHCVATTFFNKQMMSDLQMDENYPYELVNTGAWTLDAMYELCQKAARDNGNGIQDGYDTFGMVTTEASGEILFTGIGGAYAEKDDEDIPVLTYNSDKNISLFEKVINMIDNRTAVCLYSRYSDYQATGGTLFQDAFNQSRALFATDMIYQLGSLTDNEFIVGMLPSPKLSEDQADYITYVHYGHGTCLAVPTLATDLDMIGRILEDGSYMSMELVRYAYYDQNLKARRAQDDESIEQIDIIYKNMVVDPGLALSATGTFTATYTLREHVFNGDSSIVSDLQSGFDADNATILNAIENLNKLKNNS